MPLIKNSGLAKISLTIFVVLILSAVTIYFVNEWYRSNYDLYNKQRSWYEENAQIDEEKIFLMGASNMMVLNQTKIEDLLKSNQQNFAVYNLGMEGGSEIDREEFNKDLIAARPKIVVFGVPYSSFVVDLEEPPVVPPIDYPLPILPDLKNEYREAYSRAFRTMNLDPLNFQNPKYSTFSIIYELMGYENLRKNDSNIYKKNQPFSVDWDEIDSVGTRTDLEKQGYYLYMYNGYPSIEKPNIVSLKKMIQELKENKIKVIVYVSPYSDIFWKNLEKEKHKKLLEGIENLSIDLNLEIYDLHNKYSEFDNIWNDVTHVSKSYDKFSYDLTQIILRELGSDVQTFPITHNNDIFGVSTFSERSIQAEYVSPTSYLIGKKISDVTLMLRKVGEPTGIAQVGIFNDDLSLKKIFGSIEVDSLTEFYTDYEFSLQNLGNYTISSGDRIGLKYEGGDESNTVNVMREFCSFDGENSHQTFYSDGWIDYADYDLYLEITEWGCHPFVRMSDLTSSFGVETSIGRPINAELVLPKSQLVGDKIDSITMKLRQIGSPKGEIQFGVFNEDLSVKKLFGTIDSDTLYEFYTDFTRSLPPPDTYTIQSGDIIGIKFQHGDDTNYVESVIDNDPADPFDGKNSHYVYYTTSWVSSTNHDMYMILEQKNFDLENKNRGN